MALETADKTLDCVHMLCPMPILKISKAIKEIEVGQTLLMLADDPGAKPDMDTWTRRMGHDLVGFEQEGKLMRFLVKRNK
jgi:tRNA 2-thiouridine synthesizing protein A